MLVAGSGAKDSAMIGLTTVSTDAMPVDISGVQSIMISGLMVSALGIRLSILLTGNGQISRTATNPHRRTLTHLLILGKCFSAFSTMLTSHS